MELGLDHVSPSRPERVAGDPRDDRCQGKQGNADSRR
jgi:hypothetical protein